MIISYNLGSYHKTMGANMQPQYPVMLEVEEFSDLADDIRSMNTIQALFEWVEEMHIIPSTLVFYITVEDHHFRIRMINVREYRQKWEEKYKTNWKFDREL